MRSGHVTCDLDLGLARLQYRDPTPQGTTTRDRGTALLSPSEDRYMRFDSSGLAIPSSMSRTTADDIRAALLGAVRPSASRPVPRHGLGLHAVQFGHAMGGHPLCPKYPGQLVGDLEAGVSSCLQSRARGVDRLKTAVLDCIPSAEL